jgi:hypothetical protein
MKISRRSNRSPLSSRAIPALSPRRRVRAKLPECRYPDVAAAELGVPLYDHKGLLGLEELSEGRLVYDPASRHRVP